MDNRFRNLGFVAKPASDAFKNQGNSIHVKCLGAGSGSGAGYCADTTLRLDSPGSSVPLSSASKGTKRKWSFIDGSMDEQVGSILRLGLGHSSSSSDSKGSSATAWSAMSSAKESDEESSMDLELDFSLHLGNEKAPSLKKSASSYLNTQHVKPKVDLELSLSSGSGESGITAVCSNMHPFQNLNKMPFSIGRASEIDEKTSSSHWKTGIDSIHSSETHHTETSYFLNQDLGIIKPVSTSPDLSVNIIPPPQCSVTCTSEITQQEQQRSSSTRICQFKGCIKGARGASGLCIAHGGGRRCQKPGCHKGAEGRTAFCKAHGGGRRCEFLGCTKSAEGRTDFCIAHGGGRRCSQEGCTRAARGKSGLCIRHGGGKRCQKENCTKSAEGLSGLCISHGGGRRCQHPSCTKGAQGSTMFCKAHGGGKRCTYEGCSKGAEGSTSFCKGHGGGKRCSFQGGGVCPKSVHGGTLFCVAHGGGKRCAVPDCTKSARGRTDFCVRHGGGKRCKFDGCSKSAQGRTDFCKGHGGGKKCLWGQPGSEFGQGDVPCSALARGKTGMCTSHGALVQDKRVHGAAVLGAMVQDPEPSQPQCVKDIFVSENMSIDFMKTDSSFLTPTSTGWNAYRPRQPSVPVPEGRVHGGSLLAMLTGSSSLSSNSNKNAVGGPPESGKYYGIPPY